MALTSAILPCLFDLFLHASEDKKDKDIDQNIPSFEEWKFFEKILWIFIFLGFAKRRHPSDLPWTWASLVIIFAYINTINFTIYLDFQILWWTYHIGKHEKSVN